MTSQLAYEQILGRGSYKTVYLVTTTEEVPQKQWAMAVEKIRSKTDAKQALKGIRRVQQFHLMMAKLSASNDDNAKYYQDSFEQIDFWWFQAASYLEDFTVGAQVFLPESPNNDARTQAIPRRFAGRPQVLIALKPAYDIDLDTLVKRMPELYPIGTVAPSQSQHTGFLVVVGMDPRQSVDQPAVLLSHELCSMGALMHASRLVHRDIKGKNIMLRKGTGRPVLIDFGFAEFVPESSSISHGNRLCIEEPGKFKGEKAYMLSADAKMFRGCAEGDVYAMGKTLYEVIFGGPQNSHCLGCSTKASSKLSLEGIKAKEIEFRTHLDSPEAGTTSRFLLTRKCRDALMLAIRGMCQEDNPISFAAAASILKKNG